VDTDNKHAQLSSERERERDLFAKSISDSIKGRFTSGRLPEKQWLNSAGTGRNGLPPPVFSVPPPINDVPSPFSGNHYKKAMLSQGNRAMPL